MPNPTLYDNFSQVRQYIDQNQVDLSSYVSKSELEGMSYITNTALENMSYATTTYVVDYVAEHGSSTTIDENLIPKETNTYTLGDSNYKYSTAYAYNYWTGYKTKIHSSSNYNMVFTINTNNRYQLDSSAFVHYDNSTTSSLGTSSKPWGITYTNSLYLSGTNVNTLFPTYAYVVDYVAEHGGGGGGSTVPPAFVPYTYNGFTSYISTYTYNATSSPYLDGSLALNKGNGLVLGGKHAMICGEFTIANGQNSYACADNSVALGNTAHTYGWSSLAIGRNVTTWNYGEVALGTGNFSSSFSYTYTGHSAVGVSNRKYETIFSIGNGGNTASYTTGFNSIEVRANNQLFAYGIGNYNGSNASDDTTYSIQYILNNTFSYNTVTGELTINTY